MYYRLSEMAHGLLRVYEVTRYTGYTMENPRGEITKHNIKAVIYKGSDKKRNRDTQDGGKSSFTLKGKTFNTQDLVEGDFMVISGIKFHVTGVTPRIYADFFEFTLEALPNGK